MDKDVRSFVQFFSRESQSTVRDRFARLSQIVSLLTLENADEVLTFWNESSGMTWRLSPAEVRSVLSLRVEFRKEMIRALAL